MQVDKRGVGESTLDRGRGEPAVFGQRIQDYEAWWALGRTGGLRIAGARWATAKGGRSLWTWAGSERRPEGLKGAHVYAGAARRKCRGHPLAANEPSNGAGFGVRSICQDEFGQSARQGILLGRPSPPALLALFRPSIQPYLVDWFQDEPMENSECAAVREMADLHLLWRQRHPGAAVSMP